MFCVRKSTEIPVFILFLKTSFRSEHSTGKPSEFHGIFECASGAALGVNVQQSGWVSRAGNRFRNHLEHMDSAGVKRQPKVVDGFKYGSAVCLKSGVDVYRCTMRKNSCNVRLYVPRATGKTVVKNQHTHSVGCGDDECDLLVRLLMSTVKRRSASTCAINSQVSLSHSQSPKKPVCEKYCDEASS